MPTEEVDCGRCSGTGMVDEDYAGGSPCEDCGGNGVIVVDEEGWQV